MLKHAFTTLFARMLTSYLSVILLLLLLMGITVTSMFRNQYLSEEQNRIRHEGDKLTSIILEEYIDEQKRPSAQDKIMTVARQYDALIQIVDMRGNPHSFMDETQLELKWKLADESGQSYTNELGVLWRMPNAAVWLESPLSYLEGVNYGEYEQRHASAKLLPTEGVLLFDVFEGVSDMQTLSLVKPIMNNSATEGILLVHIDMSAANASISQVYMDVLLVALIAIVAAVLTVYYLTPRITKPITDMEYTVRKYSKGDLDARLPDAGSDEVARLAKSFNTMAGELSNLEATRRSFVANVSHELRSPLTSIRGFLEAMNDGVIPTEEYGKYLTIVIDETTRMADMVNDLLDLARIESGQTVLNMRPFDINALVTRTLFTFEARINAKALEVDVDLVNSPCIVEADEDQIAQVVRNLIDNAIKYAPEKSTLSIQTRIDGRKSVQVCVKDEGPGIPEEDIPHIFDRFYKVEKAHTPSKKSGTGLGLAIVKRIIDQHDESISVENDNGAVFSFSLKRSSTSLVKVKQAGEAQD